MARALEGRVIALAESRQLEELAQMLEKEGATALRCPLVNILDAPDEGPVIEWIEELIAGRCEYLVFFTGEGVRRLLGFAERSGNRGMFEASLQSRKIVSRGPKPVRALREIGVTPYKVAEAPTTEGVIATLRQEPIRGRLVGVQLYREDNPALDEFFATAGATMVPVLPYVYAPAADADRVDQLIQKLAGGEIHALILTSSPQIDRLYEVAAERNKSAELAAGLQLTRVAAIGPIVAENLAQRGAPVHICPEQGFVMKNLVKLIKEDLQQRE